MVCTGANRMNVPEIGVWATFDYAGCGAADPDRLALMLTVRHQHFLVRDCRDDPK